MNEEENRKTADKLRELGYFKVYVYTADLRKQESIQATCRKIKLDIGFVSLVVMCAAPSFNPKSILDLNFKEDIESHFQIGFLGQLTMIQEFLKPMISGNQGHFVTISSSTAHLDAPLITTYASIKSAQAKLLESLRSELKFNGINQIKTTVVYIGMLKGGINDIFKKCFELDENLVLSGEYAAQETVKGILKNREIVFIPHFPMFLFSPLKHLISSKLTDLMCSYKMKVNPEYLKLKNNKLD